MQNRMLQWFDYHHLPERLHPVSLECYQLASFMDRYLEESAEKTVGLRKLLEAKDCFVRAVLPQRQDPEQEEEYSVNFGDMFQPKKIGGI